MRNEVTLRDLENARVEPYFQSRKNRVFRASFRGKDYIVKVFRDEWSERAHTEFEVLRKCKEKNILAPLAVKIVDGAVVMEPLAGEPVSEVFDALMTASSGSNLSEGQAALADSLARWLSGFHAAFAFKMVRGDTILKNFLVTPAGVAGLDFEEASRADTINDIGQLCASVVMTDPPFTDPKMAFARRMARTYWMRCGRDRSGELDDAVSAAIRHYAVFRVNRKELLEYASELENGRSRIG